MHQWQIDITYQLKIKNHIKIKIIQQIHEIFIRGLIIKILKHDK